MSQHDIQISETPPLPGLKLVQDLNDALETLATSFSGSADPAMYAFPYSTWADTGTGTLKRRNAANTAWVVESFLLKNSLSSMTFSEIMGLTTDVGPIIATDTMQIYFWQTIGSYVGYASRNVGDFVWGTSITPKPGTELLIGQTVSDSLQKYTALLAWADANGHFVPSGSWVKGAFHFSDLGGGDIRLPDLRDRFIRATGTDADTANERHVGTLQLDDLESHDHVRDFSTSKGQIGAGTWGPAYVNAGNVGEDFKTRPAGGVETRPINTAFHPWICL